MFKYYASRLAFVKRKLNAFSYCCNLLVIYSLQIGFQQFTGERTGQSPVNSLARGLTACSFIELSLEHGNL